MGTTEIPPAASTPSSGRKRVGVVVDAFNAAYQADLVRALVQSGELRHAQLVIFPGGVFGGEEFAAPQRNEIYRWVNDTSLDALVLLSGSLVQDGSVECLQPLVQRMGSAPCFSVGSVLPAVPSIVPDNASGLRQLVDHLVVHHGYRSFAFVGGPASNEDAQARHRAFREQLTAHGIAHDSDHFYEGDFLPDCGHRAVEVFFAERQLQVDVVVAANDYMALGILEALAQQESAGLRRLPVVGFDNAERGKFSVPPLTTVDQGGVHMAEEAIRCLLEQQMGNPLPARQTATGRMVIRRSCGCDRDAFGQGRGARPRRSRSRPPGLGWDAYVTRHQETILAELSRASQGAFHGIPAWEVTLLAALKDELRGIPGISFLDAMDALLERLFRQRIEVLPLREVLRVLRGHCDAAVEDRVADRGRSDELMHQAGSLVSEVAVRAHARASLESEQVNRAINRLGTAVSEAACEASLRDTLRRALPALGLLSFEVVLYDPEPCAERTEGSVWFSLSEEPAPAGLFQLERLVPEHNWGRTQGRSQVVLPLFYQQCSLGYALADFSLKEATYYEAIRIHLSAALHWVRVGAPRRLAAAD